MSASRVIQTDKGFLPQPQVFSTHPPLAAVLSALGLLVDARATSSALVRFSLDGAPPDEALSSSDSPHPLAPLSATELEQVVRLLRQHKDVNENSTFPIISQKEPTKQDWDLFHKGTPIKRRASATVYDYTKNKTYEATINLDEASLETWKHIPGVQPPLGNHDFDLAEALVAKDERWQSALRKRGITEASHVYVDTWAMGPSSAPELKDHRLAKALAFYKGESIYPYGRPIEGILAIVDLTSQRVVEVVDRGNIPIAKGVEAYDEQSVGPLRPSVLPLLITQPQGRNFSLEGNEVRWQNWRFRVNVHPREGPVLHTVTYEDQGRERKVLHRLSLSEMMVPYGDPQDTWSWRSAFDVGEYNFGRRASPLQPGVDVPGNAAFIEGVFADHQGQILTVPRALAIYERDGGVLWKHYNNSLKHNEARRGLELVVAFSIAIGNYDYMLNYVFKQDGSIEVGAGLTGIMLTKGVPSQKGHQHGSSFEESGHLVADGILAVHHQHFFNFRIDFDIDGARNSVQEMNSHLIPTGPANPAGNAFKMQMVQLRNERQAQRDMNMAQARKWLVVNPNEFNGLGHPTGYAILPGENTIPFASSQNPSRRRAGFVEHHFWATRYAPDEMYAAGVYPNQSRGGDGLPRWVQDNQSISQEDVVVWYTMGVTHIPRPEEWPVMPVAHAGFKLVPAGFFTRNPALNLPASPPSDMKEQQSTLKQ